MEQAVALFSLLKEKFEGFGETQLMYRCCLDKDASHDVFPERTGVRVRGIVEALRLTSKVVIRRVALSRKDKAA